MAVGLPLKTTYANGDVFSASDINDTNGTINTTAAQHASGKNVIYNSAAELWQRGTSLNDTSGAYTADRFYCARGGIATTVSRQTASLANFTYSIKVQRNSGNTFTSAIFFGQPLEIADCMQFQGKTVTFSFWAKAGANYSAASSILKVELYTGTGTTDGNPYVAAYTGQAASLSQNATLTTSWQRFSYSVSLGSTVTQMTPSFSFTPVGTAGADDSFQVTGLQLEASSVATTYARQNATIQGELAACQRYYTRLNYQGSGSIAFGYGIVGNSTAAQIFVPLPVSMRPGSLLTIDYSSLRANDYNNAYTISAITNASTFSGGNGQIVQITSTGMTQYRVIGLDTNSSGYIGFSAEL